MSGPKDNEPVDPFPVRGANDPFPPIRRSGAVFPPHPDDASAPVEASVASEPGAEWIAAADAHDLPVQDHPTPAHPMLAHSVVALGRFAFPPEPPLDDEAEAARDRRWTSRTVLTAAVFLAVFNVASVQSWVRTQPPGWVSQTVGGLADVWAAQLSQLGADQPREGVRQAWGDARDARFPGQTESDTDSRHKA